MVRALLATLLLVATVRATGFSVTANKTLPGVGSRGLVAAISADGQTAYVVPWRPP